MSTIIENQAEGVKGCAQSIANAGDRVLSSSGIGDCDVEDVLLSSVQLSQPSLYDCTNLVKESSYMLSTAKTISSSKVSIYSRKTNVEVPESSAVLLISDNNWVAYSDSK